MGAGATSTQERKFLVSLAIEACEKEEKAGFFLSMVVDWAMAEILKNPILMEKAEAEVRHVFDRNGNADEGGIHELRYLKLVIKEIEITSSCSFVTSKIEMQRCVINGYNKPVKTKVMVNAWAIGRDPNYWSEADRFHPFAQFN
ncbi:hypothetical protein L1049_007720 [Liquidambar formosana]|uniref:Cytochrome P450 n=1 Tax=Liquidambar formosana TaxID=63359 RepID=A0AAP0S9F7_LIQFO